MESMKESAANIAATAESGLEKAKATVQEKVEKMKARDTAGETHSNSITGGPTGMQTMSALPGHGTGEPAGRVIEGVVPSRPIGTSTGSKDRTSTAHNPLVGAATNKGYGTGGVYT